jgi:hypothetical protein
MFKTPFKEFNFMRIITCIAFTCAVSDLHSQPSTGQANDVAPRVIPPSPEASNLGKFAEIPVSLYTGTPSINIPLYQITKGSLKLGIDLSYHASGIKVEEMASWVGIGWALNAGGVVTRTVRGKPDDNTNSFGNGFFQYSQGKSVAGIVSLPPIQRVGYLQEITEGTADVEPDQYFVNVNGITAQFTFDWNGNLVQNEEKNLKIIKIQDTNPSNPFKLLGWDVVDNQGTIYKFREVETTYADPVGAIGPVRNGTFASSWYLTQITDVNGENSINLVYDSYVLDYGFKPSVTISHALYGTPCGGSIAGNLSSSNVRTIINGKRIKEIYTDDNSIKVTFDAGASRTDSEQLSAGGSSSNFRVLDNVIVSNSYGQEIKTYKFDMGYSTGRLTLNSITPKRNNLDVSPPYRFTYSSIALPSALSKAQDHWGYFNNQIYNPHLVPADKFMSPYNGMIYASGADRNPSATHMAAGSLARVIYPTGGYDQFIYEPHEYGFIQSDEVVYYPPNLSPSVFSVSITEQEVSSTDFVRSVSFVVNENLNSPGNKITVNINWSAFTDAATLAKKPWVKLYKLDDSSNPTINQVFGVQDPNQVWTGEATIELLPGAYSLEAGCKLFGDPNDFATISASFTQWSTTPQYRKLAGGLRIKSIKQYLSANDLNPITRQFGYNMQSNQVQSSGAIYQEPTYRYSTPRYCISGGHEYPSDYYIRLANNVTMLGVTQSSHIGYREVEIIYGNGSTLNGKTVSKFTSPFDYNDVIFSELPFRPAESRSYKTGLLLNQSEYKYQQGNYSIVKKVDNEYGFYEPSVLALTVLFLGGNSIDGPQGIVPGHYRVGVYGSYYGKSKLTKSQDTIYPSDNSASVIVNTSQFSYDAYYSRILTETSSDSKGGLITKRYSYPLDYQYPSTTISQMISANLTGAAIETLTYKNSNVISGSYNEFTYLGNRFRLSRRLKLGLTSSSSAILPSFQRVNGLPDVNYFQQIQFENFDTKGNILQYKTSDGVSHSFVWGYNSEYPIAEASGANSNQIYHTSFEEDGTEGNSKSGLRCFIGSTFTIPPGQQPVGSGLVMSYWFYSSNQWNFKPETPYTSTISEVGATAYDDIKVYPKGSQMATYTYYPGLGMTSASQPNSNSTSYVYDNLGRMTALKDNTGRILKMINYNYKH